MITTAPEITPVGKALAMAKELNHSTGHKLSVESMISVYELHKRCLAQPSSSLFKQVEQTFASDASVVYVPTGAGGSGWQSIAEFIKLAGSRSHLIEDEQVVSRSVGDQVITEESILVISHFETIEWLLPGVRSTKRMLTVPLVNIVHFNAEGKIASKRVYWDQASVLRQAGVLPRSLYSKAAASEVILPVLDAKIADGVRLAKPQPKHLMTEAVASPPLEPVPADVHAPVMTPTKNRAPAQGAIPQGDEPIIKPSPARQTSHVFDAPDEVPVSRPVSRPTSSMSALLSGEAETVAVRPSSRVLSRPGGKSSNIFGTEPEEDVSSNKRPVYAIDPKRFESQIFLGMDDAESRPPLPKGRRDPNWSSLSETTERPHGRKSFSNTNESHFSLEFNEAARAEPMEALHTGKKVNPAGNSSHFSIGLDNQSAASSTERAPVSRMRRDPNARSEPAVERPSSRVLRNPGGGSTFSFA